MPLSHGLEHRVDFLAQQKQKSPVMAALPLPVGWKLIVAVPRPGRDGHSTFGDGLRRADVELIHAAIDRTFGIERRIDRGRIQIDRQAQIAGLQR
jgi:hypothetical protein